MKLIPTTRANKPQKYLLRGDSEGYVTLWAVPEVPVETIKDMQAQRTPPECEYNNKDSSYRHLLIPHLFQSWSQRYWPVSRTAGVWWVHLPWASWTSWMCLASPSLSSPRVFTCHNRVDWWWAERTGLLSLFLQHKRWCYSCCTETCKVIEVGFDWFVINLLMTLNLTYLQNGPHIKSWLDTEDESTLYSVPAWPTPVTINPIWSRVALISPSVSGTCTVARYCIGSVCTQERSCNCWCRRIIAV